MNRIDRRFRELRAAGRRALVPYLTAGDPDPALTVPLMHALVEAGADLIELGVPFSDPMADGPVIQAACERALANGMTLRRTLELVARFREGDADTPVVLMGYLNPVEAMGCEAFARAAAEAGADAALTVDMPPEEGAGLGAALRAHGLHAVYLLAPTTTEARARRICEAAGGFVYYVSLKGVTGAASLDTADVARRVAAIRRLTELPIGVGFGIRDGASAARVAGIADAVIVGSALVRRIAEAGPAGAEAAARALVGELRAAMDEAAARGAAGAG